MMILPTDIPLAQYIPRLKGRHTDPEPHGRIPSRYRCTSIMDQKGRLGINSDPSDDLPGIR